MNVTNKKKYSSSYSSVGANVSAAICTKPFSSLDYISNPNQPSSKFTFFNAVKLMFLSLEVNTPVHLFLASKLTFGALLPPRGLECGLYFWKSQAWSTYLLTITFLTGTDQMIQSLLDWLKWRRTFSAPSQSSGNPLLTRSATTASTTPWQRETQPNGRGPRWPSDSSITGSRSATSCTGGSISSEFMPRMTSVYLRPQSLPPGGERSREVGFDFQKKEIKKQTPLKVAY